MTNKDNLELDARRFAERLRGLLNRTICSNVVITTLATPYGLLVGCGLDKVRLATTPFPVGITNAKPTMYMNVSYKLQWDDAGEFMQVLSSFCGVFTDKDEQCCLFHADYERSKADGYPEAHLQVHGYSEALSQLNHEEDSARGLDRLHFPVGGRRFRPCLEDVIEFLIVERLAEPHCGWDSVVNESRLEFQRKQLRAAIRRDPDTARAALAALDNAA